MIHQCYFSSEQLSRTFKSDPYRPFGLEPVVNPEISNRCIELTSERNRMALAEYGAMLHLWRNPLVDTDAWIGFTSYRQLEKTTHVFNSKAQIENLLSRGDYVGWYFWYVANVRIGSLHGAAAQAEMSSPGLHRFITDVLRNFGSRAPESYSNSPLVPYANYWVMPRERFDDFMNWSWPMVEFALSSDHPYLTAESTIKATDNKQRAVGYFMERLFVIWTLLRQLRPVVVGPVFDPGGRPIPMGIGSAA
jgi:hypothetical protein